MAQSTQRDRNLKEEVMTEPGGENLPRCYSCGTCMSTCLVSRVSPEFNPRRTLHQVMMGMRDQALGGSTIWLCSACDACYPRCPQHIHISEVMEAIRNVAARNGIERPGPIAVVDEPACSGCGVCVKACPYQALALVDKDVEGKERRISQVDKFLCMNCGICAAACPLSAISVEEFSNEDIAVRMAAEGWFTDQGPVKPGEPRLLVFNCNWCIRAEVDWESLTRFPPNVRVITIPCSGRVDPQFILMALQEGADRVLVVGCAPGDCHYKEGTRIAQGKMHVFERMLKQVGADTRRVRFAQIDTDERGKLPSLIEGMVADAKAEAIAAQANR
jgi:coenzyme F420-reducing hydrogenase delta subunit/heterodisulfide reductase subunit C